MNSKPDIKAAELALKEWRKELEEKAPDDYSIKLIDKLVEQASLVALKAAFHIKDQDS